jgi:pimeloyl-ACP methyl ester carboxylesterase
MEDMARRSARFHLTLGEITRSTDASPETFLRHKNTLLTHMTDFMAELDRYLPRLDAAVRDVERTGVAALLARAAAGTLPDPYRPGRLVGVYDLLDVAFSSFYDPQWYSLAYFIDAASGAGVGRRAVAQTPYSFPAVFCADWKLPVDGFPDWYRKLADIRAPQMPVSPLAASGVAACLGRWSRPDNPQRPLKPATVPTLLLGSRHDPATPYVWAQRAAAQLGSNATLATYNGWGHVSYGRSGCVTGVVDRYLIGLREVEPPLEPEEAAEPESGVLEMPTDVVYGDGR